VDNLIEIFQDMDPKSEVFKKMSMKQNKLSHIVSHGLYPHYLKKMIARIAAAPGFTLGTDAGTFKLHGLSKLVDLVIRYFVRVWDLLELYFFPTKNKFYFSLGQLVQIFSDLYLSRIYRNYICG
jgi:hypothetical protein